MIGRWARAGRDDYDGRPRARAWRDDHNRRAGVVAGSVGWAMVMVMMLMVFAGVRDDGTGNETYNGSLPGCHTFANRRRITRRGHIGFATVEKQHRKKNGE